MFWKKDDSEKKRPLVRKRVWVPIAIVIAVGALFFIPLPTSSDFMQEKATQGQYMEKFLHDTDNGFHDLMYAARMQKDFSYQTESAEERIEIDEQFSELCDLDVSSAQLDPKILELVKENQETLAIVKRAIGKTCTAPEISGPGAGLPYLSMFRQLARLEIADAKARESKGDIAGAYQDYYDTFKVGKASSNGGCLISGLVGIAINSMALQAMKPTLSALDEAQLRQLIQELDSAESTATPFVEVLKPEHQMISEGIGLLSHRGYVSYDLTDYSGSNKKMVFVGVPKTVVGNAFWLYCLVNRVKMERTAQDYISTSVRLAQAPYGSSEEEKIQSYLESQDGPIANNMLLQVLAPALDRAKDAYKRQAVYFRGTKLVAAKYLYQKNHGELIDLIQLVDAGILKEIPLDPFSGQSFQYVNGMIYSFGFDKDDDKAVKSTLGKSKDGKNMFMEDGDMVF